MPQEIITKYSKHRSRVTHFEKLIKPWKWAHCHDQQKFKYYKSRVKNTSKFLCKRFYKSKVEELKVRNPCTWWKHTKQFLGQSLSRDELLLAMAMEKHDGNAKKTG